MNPADYIYAARVPLRFKPQTFGPWTVKRVFVHDIWKVFEMLPPGDAMAQKMLMQYRVGFESYTLLQRWSMATLHLGESEIVMEDSWTELQKHLPIWLRAKGKVLVTGLGLGCVVRGLLAKPDVEKITVIEIDKSILRVIGHEFQSNPRVELVHCDALTFQPNGHKWDYAWHDLWTEGDINLQVLHARLFKKYFRTCRMQGAWMFRRQILRHRFQKLPNIFG